MLLFILTTTILAVNAQMIENGKSCPYQYWTHGDECVKLFKLSKPYLDARRTCLADGADLVMIPDQATTDLIKKMIGKRHIWIGVRDEMENQHFTNVDNTELSFKPWNSGEPNNARNSEHCVEMVPNGGWNDNNCKRGFQFVCAKKLSTIGEECMCANGGICHERTCTCKAGYSGNYCEVRDLCQCENGGHCASGGVCVCSHEYTGKHCEILVGCGEGWVEHPMGRVCFKLHEEQKASFEDARRICNFEGGDLVTLFNNRDQKNFVKEMMTKKQTYWIGVLRGEKEGEFQYVNGQTLGDFQPFRRGQPDNRKGKEGCVEMRNGKWFDKRCNRRRFFMCQKMLFCKYIV